jgi:hypothetical protein
LKIKSVNGGERKENEFLGPVPYVSKVVRKICADFGDSCRQKLIGALRFYGLVRERLPEIFFSQ